MFEAFCVCEKHGKLSNMKTRHKQALVSGVREVRALLLRLLPPQPEDETFELRLTEWSHCHCAINAGVSVEPFFSKGLKESK